MELDNLSSAKKFNLILGSQSPRRKELLGWLNLPFSIKIADLEEVSLMQLPIEIAQDLSIQKAEAVFSLLCKSNQGGLNPFIISSDTIVVLDGKIYGKPKDKLEARATLLELSNKTHQVITGVSFLYKDLMNNHVREHSFFDQTLVTFNEITDDLLESYLETGDSLDKAGAYGIQGPSLTFISKINGSYSNVVGFPLDKIISEFKIILGQNWRSFFV